MRKDSISETRKSEILKQAEAALEDICREHEISLATYYNWNATFGAPQDKSIKARFVYTVLLLGSMLALGLSYYLEHQNQFWSHVSRDVGISGLVGFILAMTFERFSGEEFKRLTRDDRDAIKQDVFYYVLGYDLPSKIREEISAQIVKSPFLREKFIMDVGLQIIKDPDTGRSYMKTSCKLSYRVVNLTNRPRSWPFVTFVDKAPVSSLAHETKFTRLKIEGAQEPVNFDEKDLQGPKLWGEDETTVKLRLPKPVNVVPGRSVKVEIEYQTVRFLEAGHFHYVFNYHTLDFELIVRMVGPNIDPNIKIFGEAPVGLVPTHQHHPENQFYDWKVVRPLLHHQAISVKWILTPTTQRENDQSHPQSRTETPPPHSSSEVSERPPGTQPPAGSDQTVITPAVAHSQGSEPGRIER